MTGIVDVGGGLRGIYRQDWGNDFRGDFCTAFNVAFHFTHLSTLLKQIC